MEDAGADRLIEGIPGLQNLRLPALDLVVDRTLRDVAEHGGDVGMHRSRLAGDEVEVPDVHLVDRTRLEPDGQQGPILGFASLRLSRLRCGGQSGERCGDHSSAGGDGGYGMGQCRERAAGHVVGVKHFFS